MSGGQDEASEYIKTGGVNVFRKTERTKCGNCVYYDKPEGGRTHGLCYRYPPQEGDQPIKSDIWCGEFVDREPHSNAGDVTVRKERDQPAGELREWWVVINSAGEIESQHDTLDEARFDHVRMGYSNCRIARVAEVPSPERVRHFLDWMAQNFGCLNWHELMKNMPEAADDVADELWQIGISTDGL